MITQLRDVRAAGQSAEVAVKHQQQPAPTVVRESVNSTITVPQFERNGRFPRQVAHRAGPHPTLDAPERQYTAPEPSGVACSASSIIRRWSAKGDLDDR